MNSMNLSHLLPYQTRSICPENRTGGKGMGARTPLAEGTAKAAARDLGDGWKVNPYLYVEPGEVLTLGEIEGSGVIRHNLAHAHRRLAQPDPSHLLGRQRCSRRGVSAG